MDDGSRPASSHASRTPAKRRAFSPVEAKGTLNSAAYCAARRGVRFFPRPPIRTGIPPPCTGLGSAGESLTW